MCICTYVHMRSFLLLLFFFFLFFKKKVSPTVASLYRCPDILLALDKGAPEVKIADFLALEFDIKVGSRAPPARAQALFNEILLLFMTELSRQIYELLRHLVVLGQNDEEKHLEGVGVSKHSGDVLLVLSLLEVLVVQLRVLGPVCARVLMVHDVVVLIQDINRPVEDRDRADVFVFGIIGVEECVPAPLDASQQHDVLCERIQDVRDCEERVNRVCEAKETQPPHGPGHHFRCNSGVAFAVKLECRGDVDCVADPPGEVAEEVPGGIAGLVRCRYHVVGAVIVFVMVDRMSVCERRWQDTVEQTDPPVVHRVNGAVSRSFEQSNARVPFLVAQRVYVREVHEIRTDTDNVVDIA
mmetsp:Transcript_24236/g.42913  ORF Transcript_24236/g.42913 Transcript_24236/m.42913 type:complete len:355 (-) Transcript_24236:469-1533(-)